MMCASARTRRCSRENKNATARVHLFDRSIRIIGPENREHMVQRIELGVFKLSRYVIQLIINGIPVQASLHKIASHMGHRTIRAAGPADRVSNSSNG